MKFNNVHIHSFDYFIPDTIVSSDDIEVRLEPVYKRLRLPEGRLELMTGIRERRMWPPGTRPSSLSTQAAENLFKHNEFDRKDVDLLIHSSVCRDFLEPSTASVIHDALKLKEECMVFDLSNACLGVINAIVVAANMIDSGAIKSALIVSGENGGPLLEETIKTLNADPLLTRKNIKKYIANLTIGSAAVAYLITHKDLSPNGHKILGGAVMTDSTANTLCQGDGDKTSLMMETNSEKLLRHGIILAKKTWDQTKKNLKWTQSSADYVIGHQVGTAHEKMTMEAMGLQNHKTYTTYKTLGNTGSAALPITLAMMAKEQQIEKGSTIALLGIGSGLSSIMLGVKW